MAFNSVLNNDVEIVLMVNGQRVPFDAKRANQFAVQVLYSNDVSATVQADIQDYLQTYPEMSAYL